MPRLALYNYYNKKIEPIYFVYFGDELWFDKTYVSSINLDNQATNYFRGSFNINLSGKVFIDLVSKIVKDFANREFVIATVFLGVTETPIFQTPQNNDKQSNAIKGTVKGLIVSFIVTDYQVQIKQTGFYDLSFSDGISISPPSEVRKEFVLEGEKTNFPSVVHSIMKEIREKHSSDTVIANYIPLRGLWDVLWLTDTNPFDVPIHTYNNLVFNKKSNNKGETKYYLDRSQFTSDLGEVKLSLLKGIGDKITDVDDLNNQQSVNQSVVDSAFANIIKVFESRFAETSDYFTGKRSTGAIDMDIAKRFLLFFASVWQEYQERWENTGLILLFLDKIYWKLFKSGDEDQSLWDKVINLNILKSLVFYPPISFFLSNADEQARVKFVSRVVYSLLLWFFYEDRVFNKDYELSEFIRRHTIFLISSVAALSYFNIAYSNLKEEDDSKRADITYKDLILSDRNVFYVDSHKISQLSTSILSVYSPTNYFSGFDLSVPLLMPEAISFFCEMLENFWHFYEQVIDLNIFLSKFMTGQGEKEEKEAESVNLIFDMNRANEPLISTSPTGKSVENIIRQTIENTKITTMKPHNTPQNNKKTKKIEYIYNFSGSEFSPQIKLGNNSNDKSKVASDYEKFFQKFKEFFKGKRETIRINFDEKTSFDLICLSEFHPVKFEAQANDDKAKNTRISYIANIHVASRNSSEQPEEIESIKVNNFHIFVGHVLVNPPVWALKDYIENNKLLSNVIVIDEMGFGTLRPIVYVADAVTSVMQQNTEQTEEEQKSTFKYLKESSIKKDLIQKVSQQKTESVVNSVVKSDKIVSFNIRNFWRSFSKALYDTFEISLSLPLQYNFYFNEEMGIMQPEIKVKVYDKITQDIIRQFSRSYYVVKISFAISPTEATTSISATGLPPIESELSKNS